MKNFDVKEYLNIFYDDLINTRNGIENINSFVVQKNSFPRNEKTIAIDMGGTNFRIANVTFDENGTPAISNLKVLSMPGAIGQDEIDIEDFFDFVANILKEYEGNRVGLCFSYLSEILPSLDCRIICFSKGVKIRNAQGKLLGEGINHSLKKMGENERFFKVVNDTVSCLLGTEGANMGLILGTGLNICYKGSDGNIINTECGRYKGFPKEDFDFGDLTEMKVSGAYLRDLIKKAPQYRDEIYDRGAKMIAIEILGISKLINEKPKIAIEGSVYYNVKELRDGINYYLNPFNLDYEILDGRNKVLIGTAVSSL